MSLFYPLTLAISLKYGFRSKAHKFASFVAILSIIGIAIGVAALIVDTLKYLPVFSFLPVPQIALPIGISFYTFQTLS